MNSFNQLLTQISEKAFLAGFFLLLMIVTTPQTGFGQESDPTSLKGAAAKHIQQIQSGVLVVRLPTKHRSISALENTLRTTELKPKMKETLEEQLATKVHEKDSVNNALLSAFGGGEYDFSEVYFMYDTSTTRFKNKEMSGYFYNNEGVLDESLSLEGRDYYLIYIGRTEQSSSTNTKAFVVCDKYLNPLEKPFPTYITFRKLLSGWKAEEKKKKKKAKGIFKGFKIEEIVDKVDGTFKWFLKESSTY